MGNACTTSRSVASIVRSSSSSSSSSGSDVVRPRNINNASRRSSSSGSSSDSDRSSRPKGPRSRNSSYSSDGWSGSSPCHSSGAINIGRRQPCIEALPPQKDGTKRFKVTLSKSNVDDMLSRDSAAAGDFLDNILTTYVKHRHHQQRQQQHGIAD